MIRIASRRTHKRYVERLIDLEILELRRQYSTAGRRARTYAIRFPFKEGGDITALNEEVICQFLSRDEIKRRYRYTARRILSKGHPVDNPEYATLPLETFDTDARDRVIGFDSNGREIMKPFWEQNGEVGEFLDRCQRVIDDLKKNRTGQGAP